MNYHEFLKLSEEERKSSLENAEDWDFEKLDWDCKTGRQSKYPTEKEWILAYIQKELDGQTEEWDRLVERRTEVKNQYPFVRNV